MPDQSVGDRAEHDGFPTVFDEGTVTDPSEFSDVRESRRNRRALWVSVGALGALAALSFPLVLHFTHRAPAPVQAPDKVAGLTIDHSANATSTADYLRSAIAASLSLTSSVGAVYTDGATGAQADANSVIFVGGTTTQGTNMSQVAALLALMDDSADGVDDLVVEPAGTLGGLMKCGQTTAAATPGTPADSNDEMAVCAYANKGDIGIALFANRTVAASANLMRQMRPSFAK